jgi:hypothetical protein
MPAQSELELQYGSACEPNTTAGSVEATGAMCCSDAWNSACVDAAEWLLVLPHAAAMNNKTRAVFLIG